MCERATPSRSFQQMTHPLAWILALVRKALESFMGVGKQSKLYAVPRTVAKLLQKRERGQPVR